MSEIEHKRVLLVSLLNPINKLYKLWYTFKI